MSPAQTPLIREGAMRFRRGRRQPRSAPDGGVTGRVPRVSRWLALAHRIDSLLRASTVADYAAVAHLGHVSRARVTQIMNLLLLAPDIQEALLFWPPIRRGRDPIPLHRLQAIARTPCWRRQRRLWQDLQRLIRTKP